METNGAKPKKKKSTSKTNDTSNMTNAGSSAGVNEPKKKALKILPFLLPPVAVAVIMLINFYANGLYPFGGGTIAWCDMTQQVIPLLTDLKDILTGKAGVFLNFQNAGGMNLWGVIFFFVASPFSLLTLFVQKTEVIHLVNILLILKMMTCSVTSMVYFKSCQKKLPVVWAMLFSLMYAFSGYVMLYFQNIIWLDMMYLFPLLLTAFNSLFKKGKIAPYVAVLTAMMIVNYYISYMIVVFILLLMGIVCFRYRNEEPYKKAPVHFIIGSLLAALLSAAVWIPCFIQYLSSGRTENFLENVASCSFLTNYQTTIPTILSTISILIINAVCLCDGKPRSKKQNTCLILLFLMLIPIFIEPINTMWHTGSYMSFPTRYGFITQFMLIACAGYFLSKDDENRVSHERSKADNIFLTLICAALIFFFYKFALDFTAVNLHEFSAYSRTLWGDDTSYHLILKLSAVAALIYGIYFILFRKGMLSRQLTAMLICSMVIVEAYANVSIYITSPYVNFPDRAENQQAVMELADKIDDDSGFYRVNTTSKLFDVNLVGAMGYNSISHYTSLTSKDYMYMMKRLGYSSYWMEVGSYGGTELTDALMNIKYTIHTGKTSESTVYDGEIYNIDKSDHYIPSGLLTDNAITDAELPEITRGEIQQYVYENTLGSSDSEDKIVTFYESEHPEAIAKNKEGKYTFKNGSTFNYTIEVKGRQSLYFDCFDQPSNALNEPINKSFLVMVNHNVIESEYPSQRENGLIDLGEFEDQTISVTVKVLQDCECASYGLFGMDLDKLSAAAENAQTVNLSADKGRLTGSCELDKAQNCLVSLPYSDTLNVKVNGKQVEYSKVLGDMVQFKLESGKNDIEITSTPKGFAAGIVLTIAGAGLCVLYGVFRKKIKFNDTVCSISYYAVIMAGALILFVIYIMPFVVNVYCNLYENSLVK